MPEQNDAILARLAELEARVAALESENAPDASPGTPTPTPAAELPPFSPSDPTSPYTDPSLDEAAERRRRLNSIAFASAAQGAEPPESIDEPAESLPEPAKPTISWEQLIGGKSFLILGAIIIVIGAGLFLKLAWDSGWLNAPPVVRCIGAGLFGLALVAVGELGVRWLGRLATIGFTAAGLGTLYATAYASFATFELIGPTPSFFLMLAVCAFGVILGVRARSRLLSSLSLVAAYIAAILAGRDESPTWALPMYLTLLLTAASFLAVRARYQRILSAIAYVGTLGLGLIWFAISFENPLPTNTAWSGAAFAVATWIIVHATQIAFAHCAPTPGTTPGTTRGMLAASATPASTSISTTVFALGLLAAANEGTNTLPDWAPALLVTVVTAGTGFYLGAGLNALRARPQTRREVLAASLLFQAGAASALTIAIAVDVPAGRAITYLLVGAAAAFLALRLRAWTITAYASSLLIFGTAQTIYAAFDDPESSLLVSRQAFAGLVVTQWTGVAAMTAAAWLVSAIPTYRLASIFERESSRPPPSVQLLHTFAAILVSVGVVALAAVFAHRDVEARGLVLWWTALGSVTTLIAIRPAWSLAGFATPFYVLLAFAAWAATSFDPSWNESHPAALSFLHPGFLWSFALAALLIAIGRFVSRDNEGRRFRWVFYGLAIATVWLTSTLEIARAAGGLTEDQAVRAGAVSLWWAVVGVVLLLAGVFQRVPPLRYGGIGVLLIASTKLLTYDVAELSDALRVVCFLVLGLILLTVAAGYLRSARKQTPADANANAVKELGDDAGTDAPGS